MNLSERVEFPSIRTVRRPLCPTCGNKGEILYSEFVDPLFGTPGAWRHKICVQSECRTVWLDPAPDADDLYKAYEHYYTHEGFRSGPEPRHKKIERAIAEHYLALRWGLGRGSKSRPASIMLGSLALLLPAWRAGIDFPVAQLAGRPQGRLLDVGCGAGEQMTRAMARGWVVEGIDNDAQAAARARERGLAVRIGEFSSTDYGAGAFDAITMSHVIEHVYDPVRFFRECREVLRPGGLLIVATPNIESWCHRLFGKAWVRLDAPRHLQLFTGDSLRLAAVKAGFRNIAVSSSCSGVEYISIASRAVSRHGSCDTSRYRASSELPYGILMSWAEWALLPFKPMIGEELRLIASN